MTSLGTALEAFIREHEYCGAPTRVLPMELQLGGGRQ